MNTHYRAYTNYLSINLFQLQNILHCLDGIVGVSAPNLNVIRVSSAKLSLHLLLVTLLCTKQLSVTTYSVLNTRKPTLNSITVNILRELFPLYRTDKSFELCSSEIDVLAQLTSLRDSILSSDYIQTTSLNSPSTFKQFKLEAGAILSNLIVLYPNREAFVNEIVNILIEINKFLDVGMKSWEQCVLLFQGSNPDSVKLCYRRIFKIDDDMFASSGDDFPHLRCYYLYRSVVSHTSVLVASKSFICSSPSGEDKVTVLYTDFRTSMLDLYSSFKYESNVVKEAKPRPTQGQGPAAKRPFVPAGMQARGYATYRAKESHIYRVIDNGVVYETTEKAYFDEFIKLYSPGKHPK